MKYLNKEILITLIGWLLLLALLYGVFDSFFFDAELRGISFSKNLITAFIVAGVFSFISLFPLMGLPGAVVLALSPLLGFSPDNISGDRAWPAAILTSLVWPFFIPAGVAVRQWSLQSIYKDQANAALCLTVAAGMILVVGVVNLMGRKN